MSENELEARRFLAASVQLGILPPFGPSIPLTEEECKSMARSLPWHWTDIKAVFSAKTEQPMTSADVLRIFSPLPEEEGKMLSDLID